MEGKEIRIVGFGGPPSTGKTETLAHLANIIEQQGQPVIQISYGNIVRAIALTGQELGIIIEPPSKKPDSAINYWRNLPLTSIEQIVSYLSVRQNGPQTDYLCNDRLINGRLKTEEIGRRATYLGANPFLPDSLHKLLISLLKGSNHLILMEGRVNAVNMMDLCGWMTCSRAEKVTIYQREHLEYPGDRTAILAVIDHRTNQEKQTGLLVKPADAIDLIRLKGVPNQRVAEVFGAIVLDARNGDFRNLPRAVAIGPNNTQFFTRR